MVLGAKLGTAAAKGHLDEPARRRSIIVHALLYLQYQGLAVALLAGILAFLLGLLHEHKVVSSTGVVVGYTRPGTSELFAVMGTSMATIAIASLALGAFMSLLVVMCRQVGVDPGKLQQGRATKAEANEVATDNIASPLAACLGDLLTLCILAIVGSAVVQGIHTPWAFAFAALMLLLGGCVALLQQHVAQADKRSRKTDANAGGWSPLVSSGRTSSLLSTLTRQLDWRHDHFLRDRSRAGLLCQRLEGLWAHGDCHDWRRRQHWCHLVSKA